MANAVQSPKPNFELLTAINESIRKVTEVEKILKPELRFLSRSLLEYVVLNESNDVATVNRLLSVLTPMNKATACLFFKHFLPFTFDEEAETFGGKMKGQKKLDRKIEKVKEFLSDEANDIWSWAKQNVSVEQKPKEYYKKIMTLVGKALQDEEEGLTPHDLMTAVMTGGSLSLEDVFNALQQVEQEEAAQAEQVEAA